MAQYDDRVKRRLVMLLLLLVGGAIVNVAVAWALLFREWPANSIGPEPFAHQRYVSDSVLTTMYARNGELVLCELHSDRPASPLPLIHEEDYLQAVPGWSEFAGNEPLENWMDHRRAGDLAIAFTEHSSGWPALAWRYTEVDRFSNSGARTVVSCDGILLPAERRTMLRQALPVRPIWPGVAINTVIYTVVLYGLFAVPAALRRKRRMRRGLCPICAYPVGASDVCTECGATLRTGDRVTPVPDQSKR